MGRLPHIAAELRSALLGFEAYLGRDTTAEDRQLIASMAGTLLVLDGNYDALRHHVLNTVRVFVGELEQTYLPDELIDRAREAYGDLRALWGFEPIEGALARHEARA